jgi:two-component system sensor histidine kinase DegS
MEMQPDKITVSIRDTGKGFDLNSVQGGKNGNGYGLVGMRERVQLLNGEMKINTAPGKGTCISITIPLQDQGPGI